MGHKVKTAGESKKEEVVYLDSTRAKFSTDVLMAQEEELAPIEREEIPPEERFNDPDIADAQRTVVEGQMNAILVLQNPGDDNIERIGDDDSSGDEVLQWKPMVDVEAYRKKSLSSRGRKSTAYSIMMMERQFSSPSRPQDAMGNHLPEIVFFHFTTSFCHP